MKRVITVLIALSSLHAYSQTWDLVWSDEFEGTELQTQYWTQVTGGGSNWNNTAVGDPSVVQVSDGTLKLNGVKNPSYTGDLADVVTIDRTNVWTGAVESQYKVDFLYGKVEIRARIETAYRAWPALWLMPTTSEYGGNPDSGEIDIVEKLNKTSYFYSTIHTEYHTTNKGDPERYTTEQADVEEWHVYAVEWDAEKIVFLMDGNAYHTFNRNGDDFVGGLRRWPFDQEFYIILSQQIGGGWVDGEANGDLLDSDMPLVMEIDYVRLYEESTETYVPEEEAIAYFPFDGDILDWSTAGKDFDAGVNNGATFVSDPSRGDVMSFDGDDMITLQSGTGTVDGLPSRKEITFSTWVKTDAADEWGGFFGAFQDNGAEESGWVLGTRNQKFSVGLTGANQTITYLTDDSDFTLGKWYHVAATYDGVILRLYVDGVEKVTAQISGNLYYLNSGWFQIGAYKDNDEDNGHNGLLDDVTIWERALSESEISDLYTATVLAVEPDVLYAEQAFKFYPNPASNNLTIELENDTQVSIASLKGEVMFNEVLTGATSVSLDQFSKGVYFIKALGRTEKLIID
jgi:beta-glucanase (GH16 family)